MKNNETIGSAAQERGRLNPKDLVFIAVFGVLLFIVFMAVEIPFGMNAGITWFAHAAGALFAGSVFMYLAHRVPKRGAFSLMGVIAGAVAFLMGMFWSGPVGIVVGGVAADVVVGAPGKRTWARLIAAFAVFVFCFWFGHISMILAMGDTYVDLCVAAGVTPEYGQTLVDSILGPMGVVTGAVTIVGGLAGGYIGTKVFSKHFAKFGV